MPLLETQNLSYVYSENTPFRMVAIDDVNISIEKGELVGIIGHTGSGKSTLVQHLNGLLEPTSGKVLLNGEDISSSKAAKRAARFHVGLCFQYPEYQLFESTVRKDIAFGPHNMGLSAPEIEQRVHRAAAFVGLRPEHMEKSPFDLSGGEKRRVAIAGVMAMEPEILILDEPTNGLDPIGIAEVRNFIKELSVERGKTILISSHILSEIALLADDIGIIDHGVLLEEESLEELEQRNGRYIHFRISDAAQAGRILETQFHTQNFSIKDDHNLMLYDLNLDAAFIIHAFDSNKVAVSEAHLCEETLEDYFKKVTGGEGIA